VHAKLALAREPTDGALVLRIIRFKYTAQLPASGIRASRAGCLGGSEQLACCHPRRFRLRGCRRRVDYQSGAEREAQRTPPSASPLRGARPMRDDLEPREPSGLSRR
jgi:hypothetical protein